jgi:hypothetical protein
MADSLSLAMLVLLERLTPEQRAVLLLHDVFDSADRRRRARDRRSTASTRSSTPTSSPTSAQQPIWAPCCAHESPATKSRLTKQ